MHAGTTEPTSSSLDAIVEGIREKTDEEAARLAFVMNVFVVFEVKESNPDQQKQDAEVWKRSKRRMLSFSSLFRILRANSSTSSTLESISGDNPNEADE